MKFRVAIKNKDGSFRICEVYAIAYRVDGIRVGYTYMSGNTAFIGQAVIDGENAIIEQSTGLTDKNGKEVFEGDILICEGIEGKVYFCDKSAAFRIKWEDKQDTRFERYWDYNDIGIVGNIHEVQNEA